MYKYEELIQWYTGFIECGEIPTYKEMLDGLGWPDNVLRGILNHARKVTGLALSLNVSNQYKYQGKLYTACKDNPKLKAVYYYSCRECGLSLRSTSNRRYQSCMLCVDCARTKLLPNNEEVLYDLPDNCTPYSLLNSKEQHLRIREALYTLKDKYCRILELRFGLNGETKTLDEVGYVFGVTRERIRQLETVAIDMLRKEYLIRNMPTRHDTVETAKRKQACVQSARIKQRAKYNAAYKKKKEKEIVGRKVSNDTKIYY